MDYDIEHFIMIHGPTIILLAGVIGAAIRFRYWAASTKKGADKLGDTIDALLQISRAQLTNDDGGSMLDKIDRFSDAIDTLTTIEAKVTAYATVVDANTDKIQSIVDSMGTLSNAMHKEWATFRDKALETSKLADEHWAELHKADDTIRGRLDIFDQLREQLSINMPAALKVQEDLVVQVDKIAKKVFPEGSISD